VALQSTCLSPSSVGKRVPRFVGIKVPRSEAPLFWHFQSGTLHATVMSTLHMRLIIASHRVQMLLWMVKAQFRTLSQ
jgi:hypothetical protein